MPIKRPLALTALILLSICTQAAQARGGWGAAWGSPMRSDWLDDRRLSPSDRSGPNVREGKVDADSFVAEGAGAILGHGTITIATMAGTTVSASDQTIYEAAVIDQLVKAGYDTTKPDPEGGQRAEIRIIRDVLVPEERKRKPVSGEVGVGASNWGTSFGLGISIDLSKPKKAVLSTRLELQILDRATGKPLWEGHATIATRDGDKHWTEQAVANRLAAALLDHFPAATTMPVRAP